MILEESANENVRSDINNVKLTARRRDPHRPRNQSWRAGSVVGAKFCHLWTKLYLSVYIIRVSRPRYLFILKEYISSFFIVHPGIKLLSL